MYKLILLDRDGVINRDLPTGVLRLEDFELLPQVPEAIAHLNAAGIITALVSNQACVGRGDMSTQELERIHTRLHDLLKLKGAHLDRLYVCTDTGDEPSPCRKPSPGMLLEAMNDFNITPQETLMVGDDLRDLQAAKAAGCASLLVLTGKGRHTLDHHHLQDSPPLQITPDLMGAVDWILSIK